MHYLWIKALHVLAVISWMAGLLYLPRLFIYHCDAKIGSVQSETFKIMERRLLNAIMTPAMIVAWVSGLYLAFKAQFFQETWFHIKLALVIVMTFTHFHLFKLRNLFKDDKNTHSNTYYRVLNEIPTLLMIFIVSLVILKP